MKQADFRFNLYRYAEMDRGFEQMEFLKNGVESGIREVKGGDHVSVRFRFAAENQIAPSA
jgi:hypothetical protein